MRMDKFTTLFQTALADAQSLAVGKDNQFIEPVHVMKALLNQNQGSVRALLNQAGANIKSAGYEVGQCYQPFAKSGRCGR